MKLRTQRTIGYATLGFAAILGTFEAFELRANVTSSAPIGIWREKPVEHIRRGTIVSFCLPVSAAKNIRLTPGDCPDTYSAPLVKAVSAIEGDTVQIRNGYPVTVNGKEIPNTIAKPSIPSFPDGIYTVKPGEVWTFSSYTDKSYDSRYFGPIGVSSIQGEAIPLLVVGNSARVTGEAL